MDILNPKTLQNEARRALNRGREPKKVLLTYACTTVGVSLLSTLLSYWFGSQITGQGGLSYMGTRAIYETAQQVTPMLASLVAMCLELGYLGAMMRISRGQYADHTDLKVGFQKFWPLIRLTMIQGMVYLLLAFLAAQLGSMLFMLTPWAEPLMEILTPLMASGTMTLDESTALRAMEYMGPMFIIVGFVYLAVLIPFMHRFRMANYCLLDDPRGRAMAALRSSTRMMRRRFVPMLKLDLSLWTYYLATVVMTIIMYSDLILASLGVTFPVDDRLVSLSVYVLALAVQFAMFYLLRNRVELTYLAAYEKLREKPKDSGVVLGNIFDM